MEERKCGIKDVAARAGVCVTTASKVVNGQTCRPALRTKVLAAMKELNYKQNIFARATRTNKTGLIGLLIDRSAENVFPFLQSLIVDFISSATEWKKSVILEYCDTRKDEELPNILFQTDGCILFGHFEDSFFKKANLIVTIPLVTYWERMPYRNGLSLKPDILPGIRAGIEHLFLLNHEKIGIVSDRENAVSDKKDDSFRQVFLEYRKDPGNARFIYADRYSGTYAQQAYAAVKELLTREPDVSALFFMGNPYAFGGIQAVSALRKTIPDDISVITFDDCRWAREMIPAVTAIGCPALMDTLVGQLLHRLENGVWDEKNLSVRYELVRRESVTFAPEGQAHERGENR